jgi:hypothetical protein
MDGLSELIKHISDINSAWRIAGYAICGILVVLTILVNKKFRKISNQVAIAIMVVILLLCITPTIADAYVKTHIPPPSQDPKVTVEVLDPSKLVHATHDLLISNSLNKPTQTVDNEYEFTFKKEELTQDSSITITAQTNDKCSIGDTTIKISGYQNYKAILVLKKVCELSHKTFSLNFNSPTLAKKIRDSFSYVETDKSADYKISLSIDNNNINHNEDSWSLNECYPVITINGITCSKVNCCKIGSTMWSQRKDVILKYVNEKLHAIPESCFSEQTNKIIAWLRKN